MNYHATVLFNQQKHRFEADAADGLVIAHQQTVEAHTPELAAEQMWMLCQNIDEAWSPAKLRSMAIGDLVALREPDGTVILCQCMNTGFHAVELFGPVGAA